MYSRFLTNSEANVSELIEIMKTCFLCIGSGYRKSSIPSNGIYLNNSYCIFGDILTSILTVREHHLVHNGVKSVNR